MKILLDKIFNKYMINIVLLGVLGLFASFFIWYVLYFISESTAKKEAE
jgi:hypothetical protein